MFIVIVNETSCSSSHERAVGHIDVPGFSLSHVRDAMNIISFFTELNIYHLSLQHLSPHMTLSTLYCVVNPTVYRTHVIYEPSNWPSPP